MAVHFHPLTIKDIRRETPECVSISFDIPEALADTFRFTQGQNITLRTQVNGEEIRRSYSICAAPYENELRVAIKEVFNGTFSGFANKKLKTGDVLEVMPPTGRFFTPLDPGTKRNYLAFAAGSGITPVLSLIKTTLVTEPQSSFTLVYGNRNRGSIIFREELEALKNKYVSRFRVVHILSREQSDTPIGNGRIDAEKCRQLFHKLIDPLGMHAIYLCGPETMIFAVKESLEAIGVDKAKIHFELFNTPGQTNDIRPVTLKENQGKTSKVTIRLDGNAFSFDLPWNGISVLDAALAKGADLPFACKGGVCCTCRAKVVKGEVDMDINYALEKDELAAGFVLTCQAHPRSDEVEIDFDQR